MKKRYSKKLFTEISVAIYDAADPVSHGRALVALWSDVWSDRLISEVSYLVDVIEAAQNAGVEEITVIDNHCPDSVIGDYISRCRECDGFGVWYDGSHSRICHECNGTGQEVVSND